MPITGGAGLEALWRKKLDDSLIEVVKPEDVEEYGGKGYGVYSPFLVEYPGGETYILFCGGGSGHVFVADINEDFEVSNIRKIIDAGEPSNSTYINTVSAFLDRFNDQWMIFTNHYDGSVGAFYAVLTRFNLDFTERVEPRWINLDGVRWRLRDSICPTTGDPGVEKCLYVAYDYTDGRAYCA